jgi:endonuclease YncB( thermonuclease family)
MIGYNSAELRTTSADERQHAIAARDFLADMILNRGITVDMHGADKYGRVLARVYTKDNIPIDVCEYMIANGHGAAYTGRGEKRY